MSEAAHNLMVVGTQRGHWARYKLEEIAVSLYGYPAAEFSNNSTEYAAALPNELAFNAFLAINKVVASQSAEVGSGQILYVPAVNRPSVFETVKRLLHHQQADETILSIQAELVFLNSNIAKLDQQTQQYFAEGHHFLSAAVAGMAADGVINLRKSELSLANELIVDRLKKISALAGQANHHSGAKAPYRAQIQLELNALENDVGHFLVTAGRANQADRVNFKTGTGAKWKRAVYDIKRTGLDTKDIKAVSRYINQSIDQAKLTKLLGRLAIGVSAGEAVAHTGMVCYQQGFGQVCAANAAVDLAGLGGVLAGGFLGEEVGTGLCNLVLDEETLGTGVIVCRLTVPIVTGAASGYGSKKFLEGQAIALVHTLYPQVDIGEGG